MHTNYEKFTLWFRLTLRWLLLGWWAVPGLILIAFLAVILDAGGSWDGEKWNYDPDLTRLFQWSCAKLSTFFQLTPTTP